MTAMRRNRANAWCGAVCAAVVLWAGGAAAQGLRFYSRRDVEVPDYATLRIGPFYSTVALYLEAGWRYTESRGSGTDFLYEERRGRIQRDGHEYPLIAALITRNYLVLTPSTDLDASVRVQYEHYPMGTQEDEFRIDLAEEGVFGNLSAGFAITPFIKGELYDIAAYRTDYIDTRGMEDPYGGERYEHFSNELGLYLDWLITDHSNLGISGSRTDVVPFEEGFEYQDSTAYYESATYQRGIMAGLVAGATASFRQEQRGISNLVHVTTESYMLDLDAGQGAIFGLMPRSTLSLGVGYSTGESYEEATSTTTTIATAVGTAALRTDLSPGVWHELTYSRTVGLDFNFPLAITDLYDYRIDRDREWVDMAVFTGLRVVTPARAEWAGYRHWYVGGEVSAQLSPFIILGGATTYRVQQNRAVPGEGAVYAEGATNAVDLATSAPPPDAGIDEEWLSDYATWVSRVTLAFLLTEDLVFETYAQYVERISENDRLAYEREIYGARFMYLHEF